MGRWPFSTPPEAATLAQLLIYEEALAQLGAEAKKAEAESQVQPKPPRRLRGKSKEDFYAAIRRQAQGDNGH